MIRQPLPISSPCSGPLNCLDCRVHHWHLVSFIIDLAQIEHYISLDTCGFTYTWTGVRFKIYVRLQDEQVSWSHSKCFDDLIGVEGLVGFWCVHVCVIVLVKGFPVCETWKDTSQTVEDRRACVTEPGAPCPDRDISAGLYWFNATNRWRRLSPLAVTPRTECCNACCKSLLAEDIPPCGCRWVCVCSRVGVPQDSMWGEHLMNETWLLKSGWRMRLMVES